MKKFPDLLIFLFLFVLCLSVYSSALNNNFIFDDNFLVVKNLYIQNISLIPQLFKTDIFHFQHPEDPALGTYYRPLQALSYSFDYFFWKLNPLGYRLTNIFIHALNSFLLFLIIRLIFRNIALGLLSAVLFVIHPIHVCLVSFVAGRSNLLEAFFMYLSLWGFIKYSAYEKKRRYIIVSLLSFILALFSREGALLLPLFIFVCARALNIRYKKIFVYLIPFLCICVFYIALRAKFIPCDKLNLFNSLSLVNLSKFFFLTGDYIGQLILPVYFQASLFGKNIFLRSAVSFLAVGFIACLLFKAIMRRQRVAIFASLFYFIGLLPVFYLYKTIGYFGKILSEHYVYIASAGFFIFLAYLILGSKPYFKKATGVIIFAVICFYSSLTFINSFNYKDELKFYKSIVKVDQKNRFIRVNLGNVYLDQKDYDKAIAEARLVIASEPAAWDAYLLLGNVFLDQGKFDTAIELFKKTLILYPRSSEAFNNMALIYRKQGKTKEAYETFKKALQMDPESLLILKNFADFLIEKKIYNEAMFTVQRILRLSPDDTNALVKLGVIFAELGHNKEAEVVFKEALRLTPGSFDALNNLGTLYANMGDLDKAFVFWNEALSIKPSDKELRGKFEKAMKLKETGAGQK